MGILDDAIREHLDLKRRQGVDDDELARLEGEAFGPPARPGDEDASAEGEEAGTTSDEAEGAGPAGPTTLAEEEPLDGGDDAPAATAGEPVVQEPEAVDPAEQTHTEAAPEEEPAPPEPQLFDADRDDDLDLDLDLDLEDDVTSIAEEPPVEESMAAEPAAAEPASPYAEPEPAPIESLETVEHDLDETIESEAEELEADADELEAEAEEAIESRPEDLGAREEATEPEEGLGDAEGADARETDAAEEDESVLEDTPDFLRDAPEDDELWFEQGEPKDFDF